jgi:hypothetical protein
VRAFPAGDKMPHMVHFKRTPVWAAMLTRRDRLNIRWLRFARNRSLPRLPHAHGVQAADPGKLVHQKVS